MKKFKYSSVFTKERQRQIFGWPDISMFADLPKGEYMKAGKRYEQHLAHLIEQHLDYVIDRQEENDLRYWVIADNYKIVAGVNMFDDATLAAEALLCYSPYYSVIDVFGHNGLVWHAELLDDDPESKERRFYGRTNHIPASEWPDIKITEEKERIRWNKFHGKKKQEKKTDEENGGLR